MDVTLWWVNTSKREHHDLPRVISHTNLLFYLFASMIDPVRGGGTARCYTEGHFSVEGRVQMLISGFCVAEQSPEKRTDLSPATVPDAPVTLSTAGVLGSAKLLWQPPALTSLNLHNM